MKVVFSDETGIARQHLLPGEPVFEKRVGHVDGSAGISLGDRALAVAPEDGVSDEDAPVIRRIPPPTESVAVLFTMVLPSTLSSEPVPF